MLQKYQLWVCVCQSCWCAWCLQVFFSPSTCQPQKFWAGATQHSWGTHTVATDRCARACCTNWNKLKQIVSFFAQAHFCRGVIDWSCRRCDSAMHEKSTLCRRSRCSSRWTRSFGLPRCFHHHQHHEKLIKKSRAGSDISRPRYLPSRWRSRLSSCTSSGSWSGSSWSCSRSKDLRAQQSPAKHHMFLENNSVKDLKGDAQRIPAMLHHMLLESNSVKDLKGDIDMDNDDAEMDQPKAVKL